MVRWKEYVYIANSNLVTVSSLSQVNGTVAFVLDTELVLSKLL